MTYKLNCEALAFILKANREFTRKRERALQVEGKAEGKSQKGEHPWPAMRM